MLKSRPVPAPTPVPVQVPVKIAESRGPIIDPSKIDELGNLMIEQQAKMEQLGREI